MVAATAQPQGLMTAEEFYVWLDRPENEDKLFELENGVPIEMPPPSKPHGGICFLVAHMLGLYLLPRGGSVFTNDTGLIVRRRPDTVRGPDVMAYLTREPIHGMVFAPADDIPTLVVEVLSPSDRPGRTSRRVQGYLRRGIPMVWVVDPDDRIVTVYTATEFHTFDDTEELTGHGVPPDFRCPVSAFFTWPDGATPAASP